MKTFSTSLLLTSSLPSILALPMFTVHPSSSSAVPGHNYISLSGAYDFKSRTLATILLDDGVAARTINNEFNIEAPDAPSATFLSDCIDEYAAEISGDLREIGYQRPGSEAVVLPQTTADDGDRRVFVVSEVCKTGMRPVGQGGPFMEAGTVPSEEQRVKSMKMEAGTAETQEQGVKITKMEAGAETDGQGANIPDGTAGSEEQGVEIMKDEMGGSEEQGVGIVRS